MPTALPETPSLMALAALARLDIRAARVEQVGQIWRARVRAGRTVDHVSCWVGSGDSAAAAVENAARPAVGYWSWRLSGDNPAHGNL